MVKTLSISIGKKADLSGFEPGLAVGARCAGLSISETETLSSLHRVP